MSPGKHGRIIREKYFAKGQPCPVLVSVGQDPLLFIAANQEIDYGTDELVYAGGHRGIPFEIVKSELHGLPIPARSEVVLEGEIYGDETMPEGPFGEFMGYYASPVSDEPVFKVRRVYYRNDPILCLASPARPPNNFTAARSIVKSAMIWEQVEKAGLPGVEGVWCHEAGASRLFNVIASSSSTRVTRNRRPCWRPTVTRATTRADGRWSWTRISIPPACSTSSGRCAPGVTRPTTSTSYGARGARPSIRCSKVRPTRTTGREQRLVAEPAKSHRVLPLVGAPIELP